MMYLDTHREIKNLIDKGFQESQAEAITSLVSRYQSDIKQDTQLAKRDIETLRSDFKHDIKMLRSDLEYEIKQLKFNILKWVTIVLGATLLLLEIVVILSRFIK